MKIYHLIYLLLFVITALFTQCKYTEKVRDGRTAYELKQYNKALPMLKKDFAKAKQRTEQGKIAYLIGESLRRINRITEATDWYKKAYDYQYGPDALKQYARALKQQGDYREALQAFRDLGIEIGSPYEYRKEIAACLKAMEWKKSDRKAYQVKAAEFNSVAFEYAPVLYGDRQLVISSDRIDAKGDETYNWTGRKFSDLFIVDGNTVSQFSDNINSEANEGTVAFFGDQMIFTRCSSEEKDVDAYCSLYSSRKEGSKWSEPERLEFQQPLTNYSQPTLSQDGLSLVFASDIAGGWGGFDLYICKRQSADTDWSKPQLLSRSINTEADEKFPVFDADTLYFSSTGHVGMGGLDVFYSYMIGNRWTPAVNLLPPVNSPSDDFGFVADRRQELPEGVLQRGYFTSSRPEGAGNDDIYLYQKVVLPPEPEPEIPIVQKLFLDIYILEKVYQNPADPNSKVLGRKPIDGAGLLVLAEGADQEYVVGADGKHTMEVQPGESYKFVASKKGYLSNQKEFSTKAIALDPTKPEHTFEIEIVLDKIFLNQEIVLENIYYDFDESDIREDAEPTLNALSEMLNRNPEINIQLGSHTDCRGSNSYNQDLSQARAQSAVQYLIDLGIDDRRLSAKGYGESKHAVECVCTRCTEEEHQKNRRTTFAIIE